MSEEEQVYESQSLSTRLSNYTIINAVFKRYASLKEKNSYIKNGLETAEYLTQPVLRKLDDKLHLDDKGVAILDKIENTATSASSYYSQQKENAYGVTHSLITTANRPVHLLLDYTEAVLNHVLPPSEEPIVPVDVDSDDDSFAEGTEVDNDTVLVLESPINRIKRITVSVPQRLAERFIPLQTETVGYATEMLKYAYETVDVEGKKILFYENASVVQLKFEEKKEDILRMVTPAIETLERQTADIKDRSVQAIVAALSAITHVAEILRQQLAGTAIDPSKLNDHLIEIIKLTKSAISRLKEHELAVYVQKFKETASITIQALLDFTYSYTPEKLIPLLVHISKLSHLKPENVQSEEPPSH